MFCRFFCFLGLLGLLLSPALGDEKLKGIACRSVHFSYPSEPCTAFYNEVEVLDSAPGTFFMVCGWQKGYFGIQELYDGKKVLIFSVWDSDNDDPDAAKPQDRVQLVHQEKGVRIGRFGGEGSGGQSFYDFDWQPNTKYRFLVKSEVDQGRTSYFGYFYHPEDKEWKKLVGFSTKAGGMPLKGLHSFVEDFKRDRESATKTRQAIFGNGWVMTKDKEWQPLQKARFTADSNPVTNIFSDIKSERFVLATGGEMKLGRFQLLDVLELESHKELTPPTDWK